MGDQSAGVISPPWSPQITRPSRLNSHAVLGGVKASATLCPFRLQPRNSEGFGIVTRLYQASLAKRAKGIAHGVRVKDLRIDPPHAAWYDLSAGDDGASEEETGVALADAEPPCGGLGREPRWLRRITGGQIESAAPLAHAHPGPVVSRSGPPAQPIELGRHCRITPAPRH